eukprot:3765519-Pyramimonas_sp.AAC.1
MTDQSDAGSMGIFPKSLRIGRHGQRVRPQARDPCAGQTPDPAGERGPLSASGREPGCTLR